MLTVSRMFAFGYFWNFFLSIFWYYNSFFSLVLQYGLPLKIVSYKDLYGWTMDEIVKMIGLKNNCTFCGVFRRQVELLFSNKAWNHNKCLLVSLFLLFLIGCTCVHTETMFLDLVPPYLNYKMGHSFLQIVFLSEPFCYDS